MFLTYSTDPRSIYRPLFARKQICKCFIINPKFVTINHTINPKFVNYKISIAGNMPIVGESCYRVYIQLFQLIKGPVIRHLIGGVEDIFGG